MNIHQIVEIEIKWGTKPTPEQQISFKTLVGTDLKLQESGEIEYWAKSLTISLDKALQLGLPFEIVKVLDYVGTDSLLEQSLERSTTALGPVNERCQVIVGSGAYNVTETKLLSDGCTDQLNNELRSGWHILAVCVQPDQRRPDYILGKV